MSCVVRPPRGGLPQAASHKSSDELYISPFSARAHKAGIRDRGGKPDDISVIVSVVSRSD